MRYNFFLFFILSFIINLVSISAVVSPNHPQINFDLSKDIKTCKEISLFSDAPATVSLNDVWAKEYGEVDNLHLFSYSAENHGIEINYLDAIDFTKSGKVDVEICVTASKLGEYKGALIYAPEGQEGNVIQYASWLKVIVEEETVGEENIPDTFDSNPSLGGGGSSRGKITLDIKEKPAPEQTFEDKNEIEQLAIETESAEIANDEVTTNTDEVLQREQRIKWYHFIPVVFIVFVLLMKTYVVRKKRQLR